MKTKPKKKVKAKPVTLSWAWREIMSVEPKQPLDVNKSKLGKAYGSKSIKEVIGTVSGNAYGLSWVGLFKTKDNKFLFVKSFDNLGYDSIRKRSYVAEKLPPLISSVFKKPDKSRLFNSINKYLS